MVNESSVEYVICVYANMEHTPESVVRRCSQCLTEVWCQPHNLLLKPLCLHCGGDKLKNDQAVPCVRIEDVVRAVEYIAEKRKQEVNHEKN